LCFLLPQACSSKEVRKLLAKVAGIAVALEQIKALGWRGADGSPGADKDSIHFRKACDSGRIIVFSVFPVEKRSLEGWLYKRRG
jgi:hypothetical protein